MGKCRGCGEAVDEGNPVNGRMFVAGGAGAMHIECELSGLKGCCDEQISIANDLGEELELLKTKNDELLADNERLKAFIADKIHDATRERMMMEVDYKGVGCD